MDIAYNNRTLENLSKIFYVHINHSRVHFPSGLIYPSFSKDIYYKKIINIHQFNDTTNVNSTTHEIQSNPNNFRVLTGSLRTSNPYKSEHFSIRVRLKWMNGPRTPLECRIIIIVWGWRRPMTTQRNPLCGDILTYRKRAPWILHGVTISMAYPRGWIFFAGVPWGGLCVSVRNKHEVVKVSGVNHRV